MCCQCEVLEGKLKEVEAVAKKYLENMLQKVRIPDYV